MAKYDKADLERRMQGAVEALRHDLSGLRTGRANTALLDTIATPDADAEFAFGLDVLIAGLEQVRGAT